MAFHKTMNKILFFDTETTGLIRDGQEMQDKDFPRLVQLSALLFSEVGTLLESINLYIKPENFEIKNTNIHGITTEFAEENGENIVIVLNRFLDLCGSADILVCHNFSFDSSIVLFELNKCGIISAFKDKRSFCTMTECSTTTKSISLQDLHVQLFKTNFENSHNSIVDVEVTAKCFFEMLNRKILIKEKDYYKFIGIENVEEDRSFILDKENVKFFNAFNLISKTNKNIYLTGKAGTGKTTFLKYLRNNVDKQIVTVAPTGVAAINAGGQTINSFFQLPFRPFLPDDEDLGITRIHDFLKYTSNKKETIRKLEILVIDEVSMVRTDIIDAIEIILRTFRGKNVPFGGVQVILIGDLFQLPPIEGNEWNAVSKFYGSSYFFSSMIIQKILSTGDLICIELDKVYRQNEIEFIELLNRVRVGKQTQADLNRLNNRLTYDQLEQSDNYITLSTTNSNVNAINSQKIEELEGELISFSGQSSGEFQESIKSAPQILELKVGAQVMLLKNKGTNYNGQIGKIKKLNSTLISVLFDGERQPITIDKATWFNIEYVYDKEKHKIIENIKGTYTQYPLKLAWAITVHKSQGMTFDKVIADVGAAFASGQVYVALSRCTSLNGLILRSKIYPSSIKVDRRVLSFSEIQTPDTTIVSFINDGRADTLYKLFLTLILKNEVSQAFNTLKEAISYRNDLWSELFQKFVLVYLKKYKMYQLIIEKINKIVVEQGEIIYSYDDQLINLITKIESFEKIKLMNESVINNYEKLLIQRDEEIETNSRKIYLTNNEILLERELVKENAKQIDKLKKEISALKKIVQTKDIKIDEYKTNYDRLLIEHNSIKSKWYVRIFQ